MRNFLLTLFACMAGLVFTSAQARATVLVELFGLSNCTTDTYSQGLIKDILKSHDDVVFLNCRAGTFDSDVEGAYVNDFCRLRFRQYTSGSGTMMSSQVFINGRWDANKEDIMPAVKLGRLDDVRKVDIRRNNSSLTIDMPEFQGKSGDIFLFAYAPTQGKAQLALRAGVTMDDMMQQDVQAGVSVENVLQYYNEDFILRPVMAQQKIGSWNGEHMTLTIPLNDLPIIGNEDEVSYVVVAYENNSYGPVLVAGESMALAEKAQFLPSSQANIDIMRNSIPEYTKEEMLEYKMNKFKKQNQL